MISMFNSNSFMENISDLLDDEGGITITSVGKLVNLMKDSRDKIVPKCIAMTIISLSSTDVQMKLCDSGVWNILFQWLQDGLKNDTTCFILEILRLYLILPISFENLTSNSCPKLIKKLTKTSHPDIISVAKSIVSKWKKVVEERTLKDIAEVPIKKLKLDENIIIIDSPPEEKKKIRTVKVKNTNFRSTGVEEIEIDLTKTSTKIIKKLDEKPAMEEIHQKVCVNVDKRKVVEIHESRNFINSIMQTPSLPRKKKKRPETIINKTTPDVSINEEPAIDSNQKDSPLHESQISETVIDKSKKRVSWASIDNLQNIKFFDLDENERVNVNKVSIEELKKKEHMMERQNASHKFTAADIEDDIQMEKWYKPVAVAGVSDNNIEITSIERTVQFERERKVLKVYYFSKGDIPLSPFEPDTETCDLKVPINIPLEDIVTQQANLKAAMVNEANSKLLIYTEKEGNECHVTLRPDVANLLKSMTQVTPVPTPATLVEPVKTETNNNEASQTRTKLINIIRSRHPDIDPEKLTSEEVCKLLEPMRDQLVREGILSMPPVNPGMAMPPNPQNFIANPRPPWFTDPRFRHPQDVHMMQRMPPMPFPPNRPMGLLPPPNRPPFIHPSNQERQMRPVCRFLITNGFCRLGSNCNFAHILPDGGGGARQFNQNRH